MIGIYKYTNRINGKSYIGQSVDIDSRKCSHKASAFNQNCGDYNSQFHCAIRKYGIDNFDFEILVELSYEGYSKEILNYLEMYYINKYDTFKNGYNATIGGDSNAIGKFQGEKNGRALLTENDIRYIRECYNAHIPFKQIKEEYKNHNITERGLKKVWLFENWKHILPEYNTPENKYWHSHTAKANSPEMARNNKRKFSEEQIRLFREEYYINNLKLSEILAKYGLTVRTTTLRNAIVGITYKDIV